MKDNYKKPVTYTYPEAIIRVHSPVLSEQERAARMKQVYGAAAEFLRKAVAS